jgi:23S rRNA (uracil1939-C5)-methyltransferase
VTPELNAVRTLIEKRVPLNGVDAVQALQLADGMHVILEREQMPEPVTLNEVASLPLQWWWRDSRGITRPLQKPVIPFHDLLPAGKKDVALTVGPDGFVQGQLEGNRELIAQIQSWAGKPRRIADLFCGIGNLSLPLAAASGAEIFGAELNAASVRAATANAKALHVKASFAEANLFENFDIEPYIGADLLLLDPPRRGAKRICSQISRLLPKQIIMISCDAAAGARDGAILKQQGYRLKALRALDLFPGAGHVEAMSLWQKI